MSKHIMPDKIWAWPFNPHWKGGYYRTDNRHPTDEHDKLGVEYIKVEVKGDDE